MDFIVWVCCPEIVATYTLVCCVCAAGVKLKVLQYTINSERSTIFASSADIKKCVSGQSDDLVYMCIRLKLIAKGFLLRLRLDDVCYWWDLE